MNQPLSPNERKVYQYLFDFLSEHTYQPSVREIGRGLRIKSTKTVSELLKALANKGYIERERSRSRGVRLLGFPSSRLARDVPCISTAHDCEPSLLPVQSQEAIAIDRRFVPSEECFFLKVAGDGMTGLGILHGDYVMIQPSVNARDGDMVALRSSGQITVRAWRDASDGTPALGRQSARVSRSDTAGDVLLGRVAAVFRQMSNSPDMTATHSPLPS
jgi:repressor LexA